jgi:hypothetical protein
VVKGTFDTLKCLENITFEVVVAVMMTGRANEGRVS